MSNKVPALIIGVSYGDAFLARLGPGRLHRDDLRTWVKADRLIGLDESKRAFSNQRFGLFKQLSTQTRQIVHDLERSTEKIS
ncbi:hypothetical protein [Deinococcus alpinitundrae]|uniref:hypothetical protein n=1 Tax=Deinococcus alpinitundrae TaxID=468913 RepID=UPI00137A9999|nr:hypothetical protein [Deinococcus alpinitundrae]